ncbi:sensor histidine kinase [Pedobacter caeni]|uniref:histidine kinase n=1 Tax=Pedobacter caeni TaxID=288992 RepID=A0A1M4UUQ7_9SPHI|nr:7TM diverse intracellular signaling domain-containing protein [Pedobacter caeni]SHE60491.1 Signal transduction histidine kinase [Pedobacter caeni]
MKFRALVLLILLFLSVKIAYSHPSKVNPPKRGSIFMLEDRDISLQPEQAYQKYVSGSFKELKGYKYNAGFSKSVFWLMLDIPANPDSLFFVLGDAHLNRVSFYDLVSGKPVFKYETGDHFKFSQRPIRCRLFVFPLVPQQIHVAATASRNSLYLVRVDKHNESLQISTEILNRADFYAKQASYNLINGILSGSVMVLMFFSLFLFITVKDRLYLYYIVYVLVMCLWIVADKGYGYQFLWPDSVYFASRSRPVFNCLMNFALLHFMQSFIGQTKASRVYKPIQLLKLSFIVLTLLFLVPISPENYYGFAYIMLIAMLLLSACTCIAVLTSVTIKIREGNKQAWFYLISISPLIFFGLAEVFIHAGSKEVSNSYLSAFGLQTGLIMEALILTFGLAHRFNNYRLDREQLLLAVNAKQQEITASIIDTQENERRKISDQLHDDVGAMLSIATWQVSSVLTGEGYLKESAKEKLEKTEEVLREVALSIRTLGHTLSPWAIQKYGLNKAITDLVYQINLSEKTALEYAIIGFESSGNYPIPFLNDIYRIIQELLNNIIKHACASNAYLEIIEHNDQVSIIVEDNGKGIDLSLSGNSDGIGLESIRSKIAYFKGQMEIRRKPEHGTIVVIEIPLRTA